MELRITIPGAPRTKKNHGELVRVGGKRKLLPSRSWRAWCAAALPGLRQAVAQLRGTLPLQQAVNCTAIFYRDAARGDAVGYYQGLADILEEGGIVGDDKWIVSWNGSRLETDRSDPRVELVLSWPPVDELTLLRARLFGLAAKLDRDAQAFRPGSWQALEQLRLANLIRQEMESP